MCVFVLFHLLFVHDSNFDYHHPHFHTKVQFLAMIIQIQCLSHWYGVPPAPISTNPGPSSPCHMVTSCAMHYYYTDPRLDLKTSCWCHYFLCRVFSRSKTKATLPCQNNKSCLFLTIHEGFILIPSVISV
jgi:hypothetical protein